MCRVLPRRLKASPPTVKEKSACKIVCLSGKAKGQSSPEKADQQYGRVPQVSRFSRPGIPLPPQSWDSALTESEFCCPKSGSTACPANLTKSSRRTSYDSEKRTKRERQAPPPPTTSP